ncbi:type III secretion system chaperone family protein [Georgenia subflava]|uniref:YbjN domain-containing protein n=1 Tax=Georgenia subflava TaxID=1622177 RepID=A0A6N7EG10_9MICO|nr:YbjN domain-containing protein [Georgenia subflava]MPV37059.1 YbjN domain-containing protein [Georgenia subflava]
MSWLSRWWGRRVAVPPPESHPELRTPAATPPARPPAVARRRQERTEIVTPGRLRDVVEGRGYVVRSEPDASLTGLWDGYRFQLRLTGEGQEYLSVCGTWGRTVPEALGSAVAQAVNDWNRDRIWPTVFTVTEGDERTVRTEVMADVGAGATDRQLVELVEAGLSSGVQFFRALGGSMPPPREPSPEI